MYLRHFLAAWKDGGRWLLSNTILLIVVQIQKLWLGPYHDVLDLFKQCILLDMCYHQDKSNQLHIEHIIIDMNLVQLHIGSNPYFCKNAAMLLSS